MVHSRLTSLLALAVALLFVSVPAHAARDQALEGLEVLRRGLAGMQDFTADITQEKQLSLMKKRMTARGVVRFRKPGTFYMELFPPYASRLLLKGNVLEMRLPGEGVQNRLVLPPEEGLDHWFAYLAKPVTALPEGADIRAEHRGELWTILISPRQKGGVKVLQLVFEGGGILRRLTIEERNRDRTVIRFSNMRRNTGLTDRDFLLE